MQCGPAEASLAMPTWRSWRLCRRDGFDPLALRARRKRESRRGQVLPQEVRKTKRAQFAELQFSTFPQHTLQLVEIAPRVPNPPIKNARSKRLIEPGTCLESRICRTCLAPLPSTTA